MNLPGSGSVGGLGRHTLLIASNTVYNPRGKRLSALEAVSIRYTRQLHNRDITEQLFRGRLKIPSLNLKVS